jgi:hypothetical protein
MNPETAINIFHSTANNIGDRMCGPAQYFWPCVRQQSFSDPLPSDVSTAIFGGGQIFAQLAAAVQLREVLPPRAKLVAWAVGLPPPGMNDDLVYETARHFAAFSTRNYAWRERHRFVPCASCMSSTFDHSSPPQHEVVVFRHRRKPGPQNIPPSVPVLSNAIQSDGAVEFIASGEIVVTSSFHGVYWAQLLGRRVICIPYNDKFTAFQYTPTIATPESWMGKLKDATRCPPILEEYRSINQAYANLVREIVNER